MRLDKFLADAGLGTRSQVKTIIRKERLPSTAFRRKNRSRA